jgi:hypothetical protein
MAYAIDALGDALDATRSFLTPFDGGRWLRLAVITFFVLGSSGGGSSGASWNVGGEDVRVDGGGLDSVVLGDLDPVIWLVLAVVALGLLLGLAYVFVGSIMEFVLYESLRTELVSIRDYARTYLGLGVRLFAFRFVLGLIAVGLVVGAIVLFVLSALSGPVAVLASLVVFVPLAFVLGIIAYLVTIFTTEFVVPIMLLEDRGVLSGWRRFWDLFRAEWGEFLIYAVVRVGLNIAAGIVLGILIGIVAVILAIPFGGVGFLFWVGIGEPTAIGAGAVAVLAVLALLYALVLGIVAAIVAVPVVTYLRYFALFVLGDVDETLDLIPERRSSIRSTGTENAAD